MKLYAIVGSDCEKSSEGRQPVTRKNPPAELPNPLADSLRDLTAWLEAENIPQTVIGGVAVALTAMPRTTEVLMR